MNFAVGCDDNASIGFQIDFAAVGVQIYPHHVLVVGIIYIHT